MTPDDDFFNEFDTEFDVSRTIKHVNINVDVHSQGSQVAPDQIGEIVNPAIGSNTPVPNDPIMPVLPEVLPSPAYSVSQYNMVDYNMPQAHWTDVVLPELLPPEVIFFHCFC